MYIKPHQIVHIKKMQLVACHFSYPGRNSLAIVPANIGKQFRLLSSESIGMLTGCKKRPGIDYRIILPLPLNSCMLSINLEVNTLGGQRNSKIIRLFSLPMTSVIVNRYGVSENICTRTSCKPQALQHLWKTFRRGIFQLIYCSLSHSRLKQCFCPNCGCTQPPDSYHK